LTIGSINQSSNIADASLQNSLSVHKAASVKIASTGSKKDTAILSESAKDLAALKAGKSSQEETTESMSSKLKEQFSSVK